MPADNWIQKALDFLDEGDNEKAETALLEAIAVDSQNAQTWYNLSISLNKQGKYADGENAAREATVLDPGYLQAWNSYGWALLNQQKHAKADRAFLRAIKLDPNYSGALLNYGESLMDQERFAEAENILQALSTGDPLNSNIWYELGRVRRSRKDYLGAVEAYTQATEIDSDDTEAWRDLGFTYDTLNDYPSAEVTYLRATITDPDDPFLWYCLGCCRRAQGKNVEAVEAYKIAADLNIDDPRLLDYLGRAFGDLNELTSSKNAFLWSIKLSPGESRTWFHLGIACDALDEASEAEEAYLESIRLDPNDSDVLNNLGVIRSGQGQLVQAEETTLQAINANETDCIAWVNLGLILKRQERYREAENAAHRALSLNPSNQIIVICWHTIANSRWWQQKPHVQTIKAYRYMSDAIEILRQGLAEWDLRLAEFQKPAECLREAAIYGLGSGNDLYWQDSLLFAVQSKGRIYGELLDHRPSQLGELLTIEERDELAQLEESYQDMKLQRHSWRSIPEPMYQIGSNSTKRPQEFSSPNREQDGETVRKSLDDQYESFFRQAIISHPELESFILGPKPQSLRFSLKKLKRKLRPNEAVLELLFDQEGAILLLGFLLGQEGLVGTYYRMHDDQMHLKLSPTLGEWRNEVIFTLHLGQSQRAKGIKHDLTLETLARWGELLYGPLIDGLKDIKRLWVSPHSFLTQLPFNAIPFPDGVEREVAIIPSAASLTRPLPKEPRPNPRFTLGVVAADAVEQAPLNLQSEEVRHLRGTVKAAKRRWELAGNRVGEEPTLTNIQERTGLTRCLVLSCHGTGPNEDWGTLFLGSKENSEPVTGRQLVDSLLLGGKLRNMEVDLIVTSACLTGQVDLERAEEWLGLPLALQSVWKTRAMLLTLWEVQELPAMIWVVELVHALTQGLSAGEAQKIAQEKVKSVTKGSTEAVWLAEAQRRLPEERWRKVDAWWKDISRTAGQHPFADPVHWAPFILVGDPKITVSPRRPSSN